MPKIYTSADQLIGRTPLLELTNLEKAEADAKIKDLEQKLAAQIQNDKNKKKSPGSQKDSGGRRTRSDYEEFEKALFG